MSNEPTVIDMDDIDKSEFTAEQEKEFADKVVYIVSVDNDKREISVIIPKNSPKMRPGLFKAKQKEKAILRDVRRRIRELL